MPRVFGIKDCDPPLPAPIIGAPVVPVVGDDERVTGGDCDPPLEVGPAELFEGTMAV